MSEPDIDEAVATMCAAFDNDPVTVWNFPRDLPDRTTLMAGFFRATAELILSRGGHLEATPDHSAVGLWSAPDEPPMTDAETQAYTDRIRDVCGPGAGRALTIMRMLDEHHPADLPPHVHVMFVAVRPESQSRGAALVVLDVLANFLTATRVGVFAEASSTRSLALWRRLGAERIGPEIHLPEGGPTLYPVWGDPGEWSVPLAR